MTVAVATGTWQLDPAASTVSVRHKTFWGLATVKGTFTAVSGGGEVAEDGSATGTVTLDAGSLDTKNAKRDTHLRSADFFDAENHPQITFSVSGAELREGDTAHVTGELTVRGVSHPQEITARVASADEAAVTLETEFTVVRDTFGVSFNQLGMMGGPTTVVATLRFTPAEA